MKFLDTLISCLSRQCSENTFIFQISACEWDAGSTASLAIFRKVQRADSLPVCSNCFPPWLRPREGVQQSPNKISSILSAKEWTSFSLSCSYRTIITNALCWTAEFFFSLKLDMWIQYSSRYRYTLFYSDISSRYILI